MQTTKYNADDFRMLAVPVLFDNFVYLICREGHAVLVDAGEAKPILQTLAKEKLQLTDILITHTHPDHVGGCRSLQDRLGVQSTSPGLEERTFDVLGTPCRAISTPGHVPVHKIYHFPELKMVFSGDTLINGGCGRVMGGSAGQLFESLQKIAALPDDTRIFGGHDYLEENMEFALSVEPGSPTMQARLDSYAARPAAAIFATVTEEKATNPFLRARDAEQFAHLREMKDRF